MTQPSRYRSTYPDTQRPEITWADIWLVVGIVLGIALVMFGVRSLGCLIPGESCFFASRWLGEFLLELIR